MNKTTVKQKKAKISYTIVGFIFMLATLTVWMLSILVARPDTAPLLAVCYASTLLLALFTITFFYFSYKETKKNDKTDNG